MVASVCLASIVVSLGYRPVSFGTVVAFNAYMMMFFEPISALAQRYTLLQNAMAGAERVFGLLDSDEADAPALADVARAAPEPNAARSRFDHVTFEYKPGVPVLSDVTFSVQAAARRSPGRADRRGQDARSRRCCCASTTRRAGTVRVDGQDVLALERGELRRRFAVVPQDVFLFPGTVATNVAVGDATPDRARVEAALRRIGAYDLFARRPGGLDARVDERGENFSAGERQLIAFARALYRDAPIIILDEATASVDSDTEARLQRALDELMKGRTALIIAHRLSTMRAADRILCFQRGQLVEQGTHEELLRAGGLYAKLHRLHFSRKEEGASIPPPPSSDARRIRPATVSRRMISAKRPPSRSKATC